MQYGQYGEAHEPRAVHGTVPVNAKGAEQAPDVQRSRAGRRERHTRMMEERMMKEERMMEERRLRMKERMMKERMLKERKSMNRDDGGAQAWLGRAVADSA